MKTKSTILCAVVLLVLQTITIAQKTEVSVRKGKVVAETPTTSVNIEAGRKAILSPDKNPTVTVNDPYWLPTVSQYHNLRFRLFRSSAIFTSRHNSCFSHKR